MTPRAKTFEEAEREGILDGYAFTQIPTLISRCLAEDKRLGRALTEAEFDWLKRSSGGLVLPAASIARVSEDRGYQDIQLFREYLDVRSQ